MKMNIYHKRGIVEVILSERNLKALLVKCKDPSSMRTLIKACTGYMLCVRAEPDEEHYQGSTPGPMKPEHEAQMKEI